MNLLQYMKCTTLVILKAIFYYPSFLLSVTNPVPTVTVIRSYTIQVTAYPHPQGLGGVWQAWVPMLFHAFFFPMQGSPFPTYIPS